MTKPDALALADQLETAAANVDLAGLVRIEISSHVLDQAAAELRRLHAENEAFKAESTEQCRIIGGSAETELRLRTENEALRKDAERYRWLKSPTSSMGVLEQEHWRGGYVFYGEPMDAAIDAAMKGQA